MLLCCRFGILSIILSIRVLSIANLAPLSSNRVGIYKERTWEKMAQFHAEWAKKFYDVFVPLLRECEKNSG